EQLQELKTGIELELVPRSPRQLRREVEIDRDFDLAYYSYDYPDELYWLWPLFDTSPRALAPGGGNYMGYQNDSALESTFQAAMGHRDFAKVQLFTRTIHDLMYQKMPLIPLWQLDTHIAIHNDLKIPSSIDPLLVFSDVDKWRLEKK